MTNPNSIVIPGYRIERKLGQGGMATVYLAIQESFDREVALKIMSPFLNSDPSFTTRFVREARIVAQIHHASIVPVMDVGEHATHHYLSMEYLPGGDLKHRIAEGKHGLSLAVTACLAISAALDVAHRKGFVHRDIKPENILFREDGTPVLTDFGIARAIDSGASLTMAGMMVGTPNYMSPEQVKGQELDGRSDLYSLGIVFYETLTGAVPFRADSTMSLALKHLSDPLPPLPPEFALYQPFIDRLTAKEREDRFASGAEVARALRLINDMAHPRAYRPSVTQGIPVVDSPTTSLAVPPQAQPVATYDQTLVAARALTATAAQHAANAIPEPPAAKPRKAPKPVRAPAPPSKFALALKAAWPASRRALSHAAGSLASAVNSGWTKLRSPKVAAPHPAAAPGVVSSSAPPKQVSWLQALTGNPRRSRHVVWASLGVAAIAFGFGSYLFSRPGPTQPVAAVVQPPPARAPVETTPMPEPIIALPTPAEPSAQVLAILQRVVDERKVIEKARVLVRQARIRTEREEAIAARKRKEDDERLKAEAARVANEVTIPSLLETIKTDYVDGRIYLPVGNSAADRYVKILELNVNRLEAQAGLKKIGELVAAEADRYLKVGDIARGGTLLSRLRALQPQHPKLSSLDHPRPGRLGALDRVHGLARRHVLHVDAPVLVERQCAVARRHRRLGHRRYPRHPEQCGHFALVHHTLARQRGILLVKRDQPARELLVLERLAHHARRAHRQAVVGEPGRAHLGKLRHLGQSLALLAHGDRGHEAGRDARLGASALAQRAQDRRRVDHRLGVGLSEDRAEAARRGGAGA
jgi:serine/threonine protein kinase